MARSEDQLGNKLGPRLAGLVTRANLAAAEGKLHLHHRLAMQVQHDFFRLTGSEVQSTLGPLFRRIAESADEPGWLRDTFGFLADGSGQWQTFLAQAAGGSALSTGLGAILTNELSPITQRIIEENPHGLIPLGAAVDLAARNLADTADMALEARRQGLSGGRFTALIRGHKSQLGMTEIMTLRNRGHLNGDSFAALLRVAGFDESRAELLDELRLVRLSPATAADAVVRGIITPEHGATIAAESGMRPHDFDLLTHDTGEAPALQTLLEAYRRGIIDRHRLEHGIRTGRLRNEWIDVAEALRYSPPGPADAIRAAVQNHLTLPEARHKAEQAGLNPTEFQWLYETAGEPIATGQALELWNRGEVGQGFVEQVIREGRIKNKYVPAVLKLRRHLLPQRTIVSMVTKGALTQAEGTRHLLDLGVNAADAKALIGEAHSTKTTKHRDLSEATVLELYADHAITEEHARRLLAALHYDPAEIHLILQLQALRRSRKMQTAVTAVIRSRFVARHIDVTEATGALDAAQVDHRERDYLLALWELERNTTTRLPTVAELSHAYKVGVIDATTWVARIRGLGYAAEDVPVMAAAHAVTLGR